MHSILSRNEDASSSVMITLKGLTSSLHTVLTVWDSRFPLHSLTCTGMQLSNRGMDPTSQTKMYIVYLMMLWSTRIAGASPHAVGTVYLPSNSAMTRITPLLGFESTVMF